MKLTLPHIVAYVVGGLTALATLQPTVAGILQSVLGPYGHYVPAGIAAAGALLAFLHDIAPSAVPAPPASKQAGFVSLRGLVLLVSAAVSIACITAACSTIESFISSPTGATVIAAAVDVAVATAEAKGVSAAEINKIAKAALAADSSTTATLATVSGSINSAVTKAGLPAGDQAAADILEVALSAAIQAKVGSSASVAAAQAAVADVLNPLITATGG